MTTARRRGADPRIVVLALSVSLVWHQSVATAVDKGGIPASGRQSDVRPAVGARAAFHPARLLVRFKPGAARAGRNARQADPLPGRVVRAYSAVKGLELVSVQEGDVEKALAEYRSRADVLYAEPDYEVHASRTPDDTLYDLLWGLHNTGQTIDDDPGTAGSDIRAAKAWDVFSGDPEFRIAVIDTGVDYNHADLRDNIWTNAGEIPDNGIDDDGNGYVDDVHGYDFFNDDGDPMADHIHGTHVAGTIGAVGNNGRGVAGVNWRCKIVAIKFLNAAAAGYVSDGIDAIQYAIDNDIKVSNNSWGAAFYSRALYDVVQASQSIDHLFIAAAGNDGSDNDEIPHSPASLDLPNVIAVTATDNNDRLATFANVGRRSVDLAAPGVNIASTARDDLYAFLSGTSMAAPHVTGVVALMRARLPHWDAARVRQQLFDTVRPVEGLRETTATGGVVDAFRAVADCNGNLVADNADIIHGSSDCDRDGVPDECQPDCDGNGVADSCDLAAGTDVDCNQNLVPDRCEPDCNGNGVADACDIAAGTSDDCTGNGVPDECEPDCNENGRSDYCEIADGAGDDCNGNGTLDACDIASGTSDDCSHNGIPDDCERDCNVNNIADVCEIEAGALADTDGDGIADICRFGLALVPVGATGEHSVSGRRIILPAGGQTVRLELRVFGWDRDLDGQQRLAEYGAAVDTTSFSNQLGAPVSMARIACDSNDDCRGDDLHGGICEESGYCSFISSFFVDESHPAFVFRESAATSTVQEQPARPPNWRSTLSNTEDAPRDPGVPRYGGTLLIDVPTDAEGEYVIGLAARAATFWLDAQGEAMPLDNLLPATIALPSDCNNNGVPDDRDLDTGLSTDCDGDGILDECIQLQADCNGNGRPDACDVASGVSEDVNGNRAPDECEPPRLFVRANATGANNGLSWTDAFTDLQDALSIAAASRGKVEEIWVAAGVYRPSGRTNPFDDRSVSFQLIDGIQLRGGFAGWEESREQSDPAANVTVLTGDLNADDPVAGGSGENAYHVVTGSGNNATALLDGFTIQGGNTAGAHLERDAMGGGMLINAGRPTVSRCVFERNAARDGGGLANLTESRPTFTDCVFIQNTATSSGGGVINMDASDALFTNCRLLGNESFIGGGMVNVSSEPVLVNGVFSGNVAESGGGVVNWNTDPVFVNTTFSRNRATSTITTGGAGVMNGTSAAPLFANCILWANEHQGGVEEHDQLTGGTPVMYYNLVQGWTGSLAGTGNASRDPRFVDADGADNVIGTRDDDLRLTSLSPAIDAGDNSVVPIDTADLDDDGDVTEPTPLDLDRTPRFIKEPALHDPNEPDGPAELGGVVDLGAYEFGRDCNGNGLSDASDIGSGTSDDCDGDRIPDECEPDCNGNGIADDCDIAAGASSDCDSSGVPDECKVDCDTNGRPDVCDMIQGNGRDCNQNGRLDRCDLASDATRDCNGNGVPDECDLAATSLDCNNNAVPDECEADCNANDVPDECELTDAAGVDCNGNGMLDECEIAAGTLKDCDEDGIPDACSPLDGDCNSNQAEDECDIRSGLSQDCNEDGVPDECEPDCNGNGVEDSCDIAAGRSPDCNANAVPDACDIASKTSSDCDENGVPDDCEDTSRDCNSNGIWDVCDVRDGSSADCNGNGWPDECENDCNRNGLFDACDIAQGTSHDCDNNGVPDECQPPGLDCNANGTWDLCDVVWEDSYDCNQNEVPDECENDCNGNGLADECDVAGGLSTDCDGNGVPDECRSQDADCNDNGTWDTCDIALGTSEDCNTNGVPDDCEPDCNGNRVPDRCDIDTGVSSDCDENGRPDECDITDDGRDCNGNGVPDACEPTDADCNGNGMWDACDIQSSFSADCDLNGTPDECEADCNGNGVADACDLASGASDDADGNGLPDECELRPAQPPFPDSARQNRYIAFSPSPNSVAAIQVELVTSAYFPDAVGVLGWVGVPDEAGIARVVGEPVYRLWGEAVVRVGDCEIVPASSYALRAIVPGGSTADAAAFSLPLVVETAARPGDRYWADCVGEFGFYCSESHTCCGENLNCKGAGCPPGEACLPQWPQPDGVINFHDISAALRRFQNLRNAPVLTWVDLHGAEVTGNERMDPPNATVNFSDVQQIIKAFRGQRYTFSNPRDCP